MKRASNSRGAPLPRLKAAAGPPGSYRRVQTLLIASTQSYNAAIGFTSGNFLVGLLLLMEGDNSLLGLVSMIASFSGIMQALSSFVIERVKHKKRFLMMARLVNDAVCVLLIGGIPFLPFTSGTKQALLLGALLIFNACTALTTPCFTSWHVGLVPKERRLDYFSMMKVAGIIIQTPLMLGAGWIVDMLESGGHALIGFTVVRVLAGAFFLLDIMLMAKLPPPDEAAVPSLSGFWKTLKEPLQHRQFVACVGIGCVVSFCAALPGPYWQAYLLGRLGMSYSYLSLIGLIGAPAVLIFTPVWRQAVMKFKWQRAGLFYMLLSSLPYLCFGFTADETRFLYPVGAILVQTIAPAVEIAFNIMIFEFLPERNQAGFLGFNVAVGTIASLMGSAAGRLFMTSVDQTLLLPGMAPLDSSRALMFICCASYLVGSIIYVVIGRQTKAEIPPAP